MAVAGFRVIHNLAWGDTLYVDDLSTHPRQPPRGHGRALLEWCAEEARRLGCYGAAPRLGRGTRARGRAPALLQHGPAHHELPLRAECERGRRRGSRWSPSASWRRSWGSRRPRATSRAPRSAWRWPRRSCRPRREAERLACSTPAHAPDLCGHLRGQGRGRVLLLGHLDTVVAHDAHRPLERDGDRLSGSGAVDMKGGVALALGVMRELAAQPERYAELAVLLVNDEEWRTVPFAHAERFRGFDACLCFEAGERTPEGDEAVIVKRKAAGDPAGRGPRALGALGVGAAPRPQRPAGPRARMPRWWPAHSDPGGPDRLTGRAHDPRLGRGLQRRAARPGELVCDLRADRLDAFALGARCRSPRARRRAGRESGPGPWPGMDSRGHPPPLERAADCLGDRWSPRSAAARATPATSRPAE